MRAATIKEPSGYARPAENQPDPGSYAPADITTNFGKDIKTKVTMGSKYEFKPHQGPAPGQYEPERAISATKHRVPGAIIREDAYPESERRPKDANPDAGQYDYSHMTDFGNPSKTFFIGERLKERVENKPGPGQYENDIKPKIKGGYVEHEPSKFMMFDGDNFGGSQMRTISPARSNYNRNNNTHAASSSTLMSPTKSSLNRTGKLGTSGGTRASQGGVAAFSKVQMSAQSKKERITSPKQNGFRSSFKNSSTKKAPVPTQNGAAKRASAGGPKINLYEQ